MMPPIDPGISQIRSPLVPFVKYQSGKTKVEKKVKKSRIRANLMKPFQLIQFVLVSFMSQ